MLEVYPKILRVGRELVNRDGGDEEEWMGLRNIRSTRRASTCSPVTPVVPKFDGVKLWTGGVPCRTGALASPREVRNLEMK